MLAAYRRRQTQAVTEAIGSVGFDQALDDLRRAGTSQLNLGQVTAADPAYTYMVFMTYDPPTLVTCLGIARATT
jgi:hypothetical protein